MDQRSIEILEFPLVRARLAEKTSFGPSRRLAESLAPESDPVLVARGLDETGCLGGWGRWWGWTGP